MYYSFLKNCKKLRKFWSKNAKNVISSKLKAITQ